MNPQYGIDERRLCRRCLLKDLSKEEYFKTVYEYIESIPKEKRPDEKSYELRLEACRSCRNLINGMCAVCGCFAEVRAAKKDMHCPNTPPSW